MRHAAARRQGARRYGMQARLQKNRTSRETRQRRGMSRTVCAGKPWRLPVSVRPCAGGMAAKAAWLPQRLEVSQKEAARLRARGFSMARLNGRRGAQRNAAAVLQRSVPNRTWCLHDSVLSQR